MNLKVVLKNKESESLKLLEMVRKLSPHGSELGSPTSVAVLKHSPESFAVPSRLMWFYAGCRNSDFDLPQI